MEKLLETLLKEEKAKILKWIDGLLWIILFSTSYNLCVERIDMKTLSSFDKLKEYFFNNGYVLIFAWLVCVAVIYFITKYLISNLLPISKTGFNYFLKSAVPNEYKSVVLNVYYKGFEKLSVEHKTKAKEFKDDKNIEQIKEQEKLLKIIVGSLLKLIFILSVSAHDFKSNQFIVIIISIVTSLFALVIITASLTNTESKIKILSLIDEQ